MTMTGLVNPARHVPLAPVAWDEGSALACVLKGCLLGARDGDGRRFAQRPPASARAASATSAGPL